MKPFVVRFLLILPLLFGIPVFGYSAAKPPFSKQVHQLVAKCFGTWQTAFIPRYSLVDEYRNAYPRTPRRRSFGRKMTVIGMVAK